MAELCNLARMTPFSTQQYETLGISLSLLSWIPQLLLEGSRESWVIRAEEPSHMIAQVNPTREYLSCWNERPRLDD